MTYAHLGSTKGPLALRLVPVGLSQTWHHFKHEVLHTIDFFFTQNWFQIRQLYKQLKKKNEVCKHCTLYNILNKKSGAFKLSDFVAGVKVTFLAQLVALGLKH